MSAPRRPAADARHAGERVAGIVNTTRVVQEAPFMGLVLGTPRGIEESERAGQRQLVASDRLPTSVTGGDAPFEALGFRFGPPDPADPLFRSATLPDGWTREGSDHAMWSHLCDARGIRRVSIFYKAAFYDRDAFMRLSSVGATLAEQAVYGEGPLTVDGADAALRLADLTLPERAEVRAELGRLRTYRSNTEQAARLAACDAALARYPVETPPPGPLPPPAGAPA